MRLADLLELGGELVALEAGQALQAQVQDGAGLRVGQPVARRRRSVLALGPVAPAPRGAAAGCRPPARAGP